MLGLTRGRRERRRPYLIGMGAALGGVLAAACGGGGTGQTNQASSSGPSTSVAPRRTGVALTIVTGIPTSALNDFNRVLTDFATRNPGWTAEYAEGNVAKVLTMIAAGTAPDITSVAAADLAAMASRNQLLRLDPLIQRDRYDLRDYFERAIKQWQWEAKQTGLPRGYANQVLYYNVDLFQQAGRKLPPDTWTSTAWSWDEFLADARALTKTADDGQSGTFGYGLWPGLRTSYGLFIWNAGGDILSPDGKTCVIDQPTAVDGLQFMADLVSKHRVAPPMPLAQEEKTWEMFTKGRVAMHVFTNGGMQRHQTGVTSFRWDVGVTPKGKAARQTTGGGTGWAIPAETRNREEAWVLLQHLLSPENQKIQAGFFYPSRKSIAEWFAKADPHLLPKNRTTVFESGNHSRPDPVHARWGDVDKIVQTELTPLFNGAASAKETAAKIKQQVNAILA